jgi:hypothetical protein
MRQESEDAGSDTWASLSESHIKQNERSVPCLNGDRIPTGDQQPSHGLLD